MQTVSALLEDQLLNHPPRSERERFLETVLASAGDCIKVLDLDANLVFMSEGGMRVMEVSDFNAIKGCPWPDFWHGSLNTEAKGAIAQARAGGVGRFRGQTDTFAGNTRWWDVMVTPILGEDGRPERILSVSRDITEMMEAAQALKASEAQTRLLGDELQHRIKNTLAMVQAIIRQTMKSSPDMATAQDSIDQRLAAMGRANAMLSAGGWSSSELQTLIEAALNLYDTRSDRFQIEGPQTFLSTEAATALALMLHELGTNAAKYGALSRPSGRVAITWSLTPGPDAGSQVLNLTWREQGGPPVTVPTRRGFGSKLIERALGANLNGKADIQFRPEGVVCHVTALVKPLA